MSQRDYLFYVYILANRSRNLYIGLTNNLPKRLAEHREHRPGTYTARYKIDRLVYYEQFAYILNANSPRNRTERLEPSKKDRTHRTGKSHVGRPVSKLVSPKAFCLITPHPIPCHPTPSLLVIPHTLLLSFRSAAEESAVIVEAPSTSMKSRLSIILAILLSQSSQAFPQKKPCPALETNVVDHKFHSGQVWTYESRPGETNSTLTILRVDSSEKMGVIIHVRVDGLRAHNQRGELVSHVEHMPFTRDAMLLSVDHLLKSNQPLPTLEGLDRWRADCGGVYNISVRDALDVMEKTLNAP